MKQNLRILYIEDHLNHYTLLCDYLIKHHKSDNVIVDSARYIETAYYSLKHNIYDGIIMDVQINHSPTDIWTSLGFTELVKLDSENSPGINVVLKSQLNNDNVEKAGKLIISSYDYKYYRRYYLKLGGEKIAIEKKNSDIENILELIKWIQNLK